MLRNREKLTDLKLRSFPPRYSAHNCYYRKFCYITHEKGALTKMSVLHVLTQLFTHFIKINNVNQNFPHSKQN